MLVLAPSFRSNRRNQAPQLQTLLQLENHVQQLKPTPKRQPRHLPQQKKDWFLTTPDGSLAARIRDGLTIGENQHGDIQFNSSDEGKLFYFELIADSDDEMSLSIRTEGTPYKLVNQLGNSGDHVTVSPWQSIKLTLPGGSLAIFPELAGRPTSTEMLTIELVKETDPSEPELNLTPINQHAILQPASIPEPTEAELSKITVDFPTSEHDYVDSSESPNSFEPPVSSAWKHSSHDEGYEAPAGSSAANRKSVVDLTRDRPTQDLQPATGILPRGVSITLFCATALALCVLGWQVLPSVGSAAVDERLDITGAELAPQSNPQIPPDTSMVTGAAQKQSAAELLLSVQQLAADLDGMDKATVEFALQALEIVLAAQPSNIDAIALRRDLEEIQQSKNSRQPSDIASADPLPARAEVAPAVLTEPVDSQLAVYETAVSRQLKEVQSLIDRGHIDTPFRDNAVTRIRDVLLQYPDNPDVLAMADQCADRLVEMAQQSYQQARVYDARNNLEEALSIAPGHTAAKNLWQQWVGALP